ELESLIGFFINSLALRTDLSGAPSFRELLGRVREVTLGAYAHQDVPFEKLVEELQPARSLAHTPLFQVSFVLQNGPRQPLALGGVASTALDINRGTAKFDLALSAREEAEGLCCTFEYNADLFAPETVSRMLGHFEVLLEGIIADPSRRISELPLLSEAERRQLLVEWNRTSTDYPKDECIHQLFEAQAARTPGAVAVVHEGGRLTYAELNARANQLARRLRALGVGPEVSVGICMERSAEMIVGLLGILKAGGAYVPLDPSYPQERLAFMAEDAGVRVLLTRSGMADVLPECGAAVVCLDADWDTIAREGAEDLNVGAVAENLAYVIYTSGSTGVPKGISIVHRAVTRLVCETNYITLSTDDRIAHASNSSFDAATFEIWGALLNGARLVIVNKEVALSPFEMAAAVREQGISVMFLTTALFNQLVAAAPGCFRDVRNLLFGGEAVDVSRVRAALGDGRPARLLHVYGPTESTTFATWYEVGEVAGGAATVPIGRPLSNTQTYVLDEAGRPVPVGVVGELYIGGEGLARDYLRRPELTAERFVPDAFGGVHGARLYRTGDLVRCLRDGSLEFIGRIDQQVKMRGFRIEPGEVEAVLSLHPQVLECVVVAREDAPGERRLVAYVVAAPGAVLTPAELRGFGKAKLPEYMIPSAFVLLDELPLNANGKVDRRALPPPEQDGAFDPDGYAAPRTPVEEMLADLWAEVLGVKRPGIRDNFFALGGHSLLATQLVSRLRDIFGIELALRKLFEGPTVEELAQCVESQLRAGASLNAPPVLPVTRAENLPLSFAQQRLWFLQQLQPESSSYNLHASLHLAGALDREALEKTINEVVRRHEVLRTVFPTVGGQPVQLIRADVPTPLPVEDLSGLDETEREAEVRRRAREEALRPFDLTCGPLLRATLLRVSEAEHVLLVAMHHIISDGWSMGVLVREMVGLYEAFTRGQGSPLPELRVQYADFAVWQREWLRGEVLEGQLSYWRAQLRGAPPLLELPTDHPRPAVKTSEGATHHLKLSPQLREDLAALSRREGGTLYMTILAAWQTLLSRYTRQQDIPVGSPVANRNRAETEGLIGFFVNTLVLRTDFSGDPTFRELLARVREVALGAYAHQDIPFEMLVEELQPERSLAHTPLFQVMFALQNAPTEDLRLVGVRARLLEQSMGTAKFDLMLSLAESDGALEGVLEYSTDLFDASTVERMAAHFQTLLRAVAEDPDRAASVLPLLSAAEQEQLLAGWNATATAYPSEKCVPQLFEEQAARVPERVAVVCGDEEMSYAALNERANRLARHLRKLSVGPEVLTGICMERGVEMIVGLLAILKAGGAYLPLDPAYPAERLRFMLEDAGVPVLLTQKRLAENLPEHGARLVFVDEDWDEISRESAEDFDAGVVAENLAYVIYTSGSTGRPKGVCVPHRGVVRLVKETNYADFSEEQVFLQLAPVSFDASTFEIWGALLNGARLAIFPARAPSLEELAEALAEYRVTTLWLTAGLFHLMVDHQLESMRGLRQLLAGGDVLSVPHVRRAAEALAGCRLINGYGPTENTTFTCCHAVRAGESLEACVPIGRPIGNTQVYLLDERRQLVPTGVAGELYIGGDGLARGYLNRPELTAERFVAVEGLGRLYRTGDLCRRRADGTIEFLGRLDNQVKLRGFRIEPGEIEAVLRREPGVSDAAVVVHGEGEHRQLIAHLQASAQAADVEAIRQSLKRQLPDYMVPGR
ncbi:MAG TPA: amino acid adenylation domain-containing protein, partial [Pyrinomonadaceae bacterium]|nr:amino acid adenylation domain-containing protein [Pyrinomonadaceae bacterium]